MNTMAQERSKIHRQLLQGQTQPVRLRVAAAVAYQKLTGRTRESAASGDYSVQMNAMALALSQLADVYYVNKQGKLQRIPTEELALGTFQESGDVYRARSGNVYSSLWIRRIDVMDAVAILEKARESIDGAKSAAEKSTARQDGNGNRDG